MSKIIIFTKLRWILLTVIILLLDAGSKHWVVNNLFLGESIQITPFINVTYVHNTGVAFGFLGGDVAWTRWFFSISSLLIIVIIFIVMWRLHQKPIILNISYAIIIGGALGNLLDRVVSGVVVDFVDFHFGDWHWYTFNMADVGIFFGVVLVILKSLISFTLKLPKTN